MNLHAFVGPAVAIINPFTIGTVLVSAGNTVAGDGSQVTTYTRTDGVSLQVQSITTDDLKQIDNVSQSPIMRSVYFNGIVQGLNRYAGKGGDVLVFNGLAWLIVQVLEAWDIDGWCKVAVTEQGPASVFLAAPLVRGLITIGAL